MKRRKRKTRELDTSDASSSEMKMMGILKVSLVALLLSRFFVPAENASEGETLLWVFLTFGIFTLWFWDGLKAGPVKFSITRFDIAFLVIVFAHLVSGLAVVFTEGQKRAALNMVWEWLGLGALLFLLRQFVADTRFYKQLLLAVVSVVVALACLGIYQHHVWYPRESGSYLTLRKELDVLQARNNKRNNPRTANRIHQIQSDFAMQGIPLEGPGRKRFEDRLVSSREPFGMFALANTFAGLLAVGWLLVLGNFVHRSWKKESLRESLAIILISLLIGYCLLITKSRTAWVGTSCGATFIVWMTFRTKFLSEKISKLVGTCVVVVLGIGALVTAGIMVSGNGAKTMREAPRSLRFRFQYWQGTLGVIRESPVLGTGPGNFRPNYLKHKIPESSEEILDPHNFFFDLWANAGILAALGIASAIFFAFRSVMRSFKQRKYEEECLQHSNDVSPFSEVFIGFILALFVFLWESNFSSGVNLSVFAIAVVTFSIFSRFSDNDFSHPTVLSGCCIAMLVHMLGAGGIEMPTVVVVLLILSVGITRNHNKEIEFQFEFRSGKRLATGTVLGLLLTLSCFFTGFYPSFLAKSQLTLARSYSINGNFKAAETHFREAIKADPLSPAPWVDLSNLLFRQSLAGDLQEENFAEAVILQKQAIYRNPHSWQGYRTLGAWFAERYRKSNKREPLESAIGNFKKAIERYPTNVRLHADFALLLDDAKQTDKAQKHAHEALILHAINREEGHTDKYLPDDQLDRLRLLVEGNF